MYGKKKQIYWGVDLLLYIFQPILSPLLPLPCAPAP